MRDGADASVADEVDDPAPGDVSGGQRRAALRPARHRGEAGRDQAEQSAVAVAMALGHRR